MESPIEVQEYWFLTSSRSTSSRVEFLVEATMKELLIIMCHGHGLRGSGPRAAVHGVERL